MILRLLIVGFLLSGCGFKLTRTTSDGGNDGGTPIARALNGGMAVFSMTTCAPTAERARLVEETIIQLNQQGIIAQAEGAGTQARVSLNLCGAGGTAAVSPNQPRRQ